LIVESRETWSRIFTDVKVWKEMVEQICYEHRLVPAEKITVGHPGSNAVFVVDDAVVVKIFSPFSREWVARELEISQLLSSSRMLPVPKLLASGLIKEEQDWPYIVTEMLPGERIGGIWEKVSYENRLAIAEHVGQLVRTLHNLPVSKVKSMDKSRRYWERFVETQVNSCVEYHCQKQSLPPHLLEHIPGYLLEAMPLFDGNFSPCIVNSDITNDHILLSVRNDWWEITGFIDFGDVEMGHNEYEFVCVGLDLLACDMNLFRAFLKAYGYEGQIDEKFGKRMMAYSLLHRYIDFRPFIERLGGAEKIESLEELQALLWNIGEDHVV